MSSIYLFIFDPNRVYFSIAEKLEYKAPTRSGQGVRLRLDVMTGYYWASLVSTLVWTVATSPDPDSHTIVI